ncbi:hypothetical protein VTN31DRAFT_6731 [Thermomyces dupontii]|uniref:uncharacterized protein n=1 Tax=Talaromyces thermophilus TaxID=28565 RepID=UPI0037437732
MAASREFDFIVLGPTGFTGKFASRHIYKTFPTNLKWALGGRSAQKLQAIVEELRSLNVDRPAPEIITLQLNKSELDALAKRTRLIINCVGPFHLYSTPVVEACAQNGTHYVDISGETPWLKKVIDEYHEIAKQNGALIIPACAFESTTADLMTWLAATHARTELSAEPGETIGSIHELRPASLSGGTAHSLITMLESLKVSGALKSAGITSLASPTAPPPPKRPSQSLIELVLGVRAVSDLGTLTTSPAKLADESVVYRSRSLMPQLYGPSFSFREYLRTRNVFTGAVFHLTLVIGLALLLFSPFRWLFRRIVPGPSQALPELERKDGQVQFRVLMDTTSTGPTGKARRVLSSLAYPAGPYPFSGVSVASAANVILNHENDIKKIAGGAGFLTPAVLGQHYVDELEKNGVRIDAKVIE